MLQVVFDNSAYSGQMKVSLHSGAHASVCADAKVSGSSESHH